MFLEQSQARRIRQDSLYNFVRSYPPEKYINLQFCPVKAACYLLGIVSRTAWSSFSNFSNLPFPVYGPISTFHSRNTRPVSARAVLFLSPSSPKTVSQPTSLLETGSQPSNTFRHSTLAREREMEARQDMTSTGSTISEKFFFSSRQKESTWVTLIGAITLFW